MYFVQPPYFPLLMYYLEAIFLYYWYAIFLQIFFWFFFCIYIQYIDNDDWGLDMAVELDPSTIPPPSGLILLYVCPHTHTTMCPQCKTVT